jgi:hypothetical protein
MVPHRLQRIARFVCGLACGARVCQDHRLASKWTAIVVAVLPLAISIGITGCGSAGGRGRAGMIRSLSPNEATKRRLAVNTPRELAYLMHSLARVGLPGGDVIGVVVIPCAMGVANHCYQFAEYWEEPARYARATYGPKRGMTKRRLVGTGPAVADAGPGERVSVLYMGTRHGCAGPPPYNYPYAFAYGLLRGVRDTVTDRTEGRTVIMTKAAIPARMHPEGVLVYGLLLPGSNEIVVRAPNGKSIERTDWQGSNEEVSCGGRH